jgi:DNA helicase-2/ATP-dependent DNA helicase PcrA
MGFKAPKTGDLIHSPPMSEPLPPPVSHSPFLADLTEPQRQAVTHTEGPLLVLAAAGSGKTRVITRRAAYLVRELGVDPASVLCITFTNKSAGEMRERVESLVQGRAGRMMTVCTFHALCVRLLRQFAEPAGIRADFVIYDSADQKRAIKEAFKELDLSTKHFTPDSVASAISTAKNELIDATAYEQDAGDFYSRTVAKVYHGYQKVLTRSGALDFDDLLLKTAQLLKDNDATREHLQQRYHYLQIDEYQDTNHAQFIIAHALAGVRGNICAVGDPDQSIYAWRGADLNNILEFEKHYAGAITIKLGQNYRSTPEVLAVADRLIRHNRRRRHKPLFTENKSGDPISIVQAADEEHESDLVVQHFRRRHEAGVPWGSMAVFYRMNALSRVVEDAMLRSSIPYQIARGTAFYQRKEVKDALAYLRVASNPDDEIGLLRIINTPVRGIGDTTIKRLQAWAVARGVNLWTALNTEEALADLTARARNALGRFIGQVETWRKQMAGTAGDMFQTELTVREIMERVIVEGGLEAFYKSPKTGDEEKLGNCYELITAAGRFDAEYGEVDAGTHKRVQDFLESVSLAADVDAIDADGGAVTLMTLHAAKGLEFNAVAMVGLEEGILPHSRAFENPNDLEEERRLCFVGVTRACDHLQISLARYRTIRGMTQRSVPSPFLAELGEEHVLRQDLSGYSDSNHIVGDTVYESVDSDHASATRRPSRSAPSSLGFDVGSIVRHPRFGMGRVMSLIPISAPTRTKVLFERVGAKTLVLEYARLEVVDMDDHTF